MTKVLKIALSYASTKPPFYGRRERVVFLLSTDILEEFKLECELRRLTPRTIKGYYNSTLLFLTWLERQQEIKELEAIRPQHIKQYIQYLIRKQLTPSYINSILRCIRAYFRYAVEEEYLKPFPVHRLRQHNSPPGSSWGA